MRFPLTSFVLYPANESVESLEDQYSYVFRQHMLSKCISRLMSIIGAVHLWIVVMD